MAAEPELYIASDSAVFSHDGREVVLQPGTVVRAGHPLMKGREHLFRPLTVHYDLPAAPEPKQAAAKKPAAKTTGA